MAPRTSRKFAAGTPRKARSARAAALAVMLLAALLAAAPSTAASDSPRCTDVMIVWARGSGQDPVYGEGGNYDEGYHFLFGVWTRLTTLVEAGEVGIYELGRDHLAYGIEHGYPAVEVGRWEAYDAWRSAYTVGWPERFLKEDGYVESVKIGVAELVVFLTLRAAVCPQEIFVLGGYSQGAHVISRALSDPVDGVPRPVRDRIAFAALIADPTLVLPKGMEFYVHLNFGPWGLWVTEELRPVACRGWAGDIEPYRRGDPPCTAQHGILAVSENRAQYLPEDMFTTSSYGLISTTRVGSWCIPDDPICLTTPHHLPRFLASGDGWLGAHDDYTNLTRRPDGFASWVDQAAAEAASRARHEWLNQRIWRMNLAVGSVPSSA